MAVTGGAPTFATLTVTGDALIDGVTVGQGAGNVATNTAVGASALAANTSGSNNTAVGQVSLDANTTGTLNAAFGTNSLGANISGSENTAIGVSALAGNTTGASNTGIGRSALVGNTTASYNTAVGQQSVALNTTGASNTAVGFQSLYNNTTASNNTAVGYQAGYSNTTGTRNALLGYVAGYSLTGNYCTLIGAGAGYSTTGERNTFVGDYAGNLVTTGTKNTIIGKYDGNQGGLDIRTASNYIVLSDGDGNPRVYNEGSYTNFGYGTVNQGGSIRLQDTAASGFGPVIIGRTGAIGATTDQWFAGSNSAVKGGTTYSTYTIMAGGSGGVNLTSGATSWTSASDERLKDIIEPISNAANKVSQLRAVIGKYKTDADGTRRPFLIAQDLQAVLPEAVSEGRNSKDDETEYLQVAYTEVIPLLVAAINELKAEIDALKGA
jgi:hypothetical protein